MDDENKRLDEERESFLAQVERILETPLLVLSFIWLFLFASELVWGLHPFLVNLGLLIWMVFILEFGIKISIAPKKLKYIRNNVITTVALLLPALRVLRLARIFVVLRAARIARGSQLLGIIGSANRGMRALRNTMSRRGLGYAIILTLIVMFLGAAGMFAFEPHAFESYFSALWWTAMIMTTMGSGYWPETPEGRILCFVLALYAFAVFGYVTASIASFFIGRDAEEDEGELAGKKTLSTVLAELKEIKGELSSLKSSQTGNHDPE